MNLKSMTKPQLIELCTNLQSEVFELRAQSTPNVPRPASRTSSNSNLSRMKELAMKYKTTARIENGAIQLYSRKSHEWLPSPE